MTIKESLSRIKKQLILKQTVGVDGKAWEPEITKEALDCVKATIEDVHNYNAIAMKCVNCGLLISQLLLEARCPNCGNLKFTEEKGN